MLEDLKINDLWFTLQGEGLHAGRRALFVRMPYCNLACTWCDTSFNSYKEWSVPDFKNFADCEPNRFAVITGGEPMMNKQTPVVVRILKELGFEIACETNGMFPIVDGIDFVTVSPKRFSETKIQQSTGLNHSQYYIHPNALHLASEFKYVVDSEFDFETLDRHNTKDGRRYSLSPEWNDFKNNTTKIVDYITENPDWRLSLQTHKFLGLP